MNPHYRQELVRLPAGEFFLQYPYPAPPARLWALPGGERPMLPFFPVHGRNAFLEDIGHDYSIRNGVLRFASHREAGDLWLLLEFAE